MQRPIYTASSNDQFATALSQTTFANAIMGVVTLLLSALAVFQLVYRLDGSKPVAK